MKKNNTNGFFLSETMVVIAVVSVVLLGVFKIFSSVYYGFVESERYNTTNAINALANVQKYYENIEKIDVDTLSQTNPIVRLTNDAKYESEYYSKIKEEYNITDVYLTNLDFLFESNELNNLYALFRRYLSTLKNVHGTVMVAIVNGNEFAYTKVKDYRNITLVGDKEDEYAVYIPKGGIFVDPGYEGWDGDDPYIEWENDNIIDTSRPGTYYLHYDFDGYLFRRKVVVGEVDGAKYIKNLYETLSNENSLIKDEFNNIRYQGNNVNNYVEFNGEPWRIIGTFDVTTGEGTTQNLIKIVKDEPFSTTMSWDSNASTINNGWGVNEWRQADLQKMLNGYYIGKESTCSYCNGQNQETCTNDCASNVTPLSSTALGMVENIVWNTGAPTYNETKKLSDMYSEENGNLTGKICTSGNVCNDIVERTTTWAGKVGLIYPSDYGFASGDASCKKDIRGDDSTCNNDNWLHPSSSWYWTLTPFAASSDAYVVWNVSSSLRVYRRSASNAGGVRPAVYLKSDVKIAEGSGTRINMYKLSM